MCSILAHDKIYRLYCLSYLYYTTNENLVNLLCNNCELFCYIKNN
nr:MAG TPA: hypothetical protein [Caudoviricetes sp.]